MYQKNKPVRENALTRDLLGKGLWVLKFLREMITQQQWLPKEKVGGGGYVGPLLLCVGSLPKTQPHYILLFSALPWRRLCQMKINPPKPATFHSFSAILIPLNMKQLKIPTLVH